MRRILLQLLIGTVPLWVGYVLNAIITVMPIPILFISLLFLILWTVLCYRSCVPGHSPTAQAFLLCTFGFVMYLFVAYQEYVRGAYWVSWFGLATQMYFLPGLSAAASISRIFLNVLAIAPVSLFEMVILFLLALAGCTLKVKKTGK